MSDLSEAISTHANERLAENTVVTKWLCIIEADTIDGRSLITASSTTLTDWDAAGLSAVILAQAQHAYVQDGDD